MANPKRSSVPRLLADQQLVLDEIVPDVALYVSQADAAQALGITTRMIQYWESQGLLHPERPQEGRNRRYTQRDLVELRFVKEMLADQGYTVPALREKLEKLEAPFHYDPREIFWDLRDERWKTRRMVAVECLTELHAELLESMAEALRKLAPEVQRPEAAVRALLELVRSRLAGGGPTGRGKARRRK